jgi:hypothetical protein
VEKVLTRRNGVKNRFTLTEHIRRSEMQGLRRRLLLVSLLVVASIAATLAQTEKVYVTKTGAKYHRASCGSLAKSKIEMSLARAAAQYGACKNCRPPVPTTLPAVEATPISSVAAAAPPTKSAPVASGRCQATTKKGTQCSRNAQPSRNYCWQH